MAHADRTSSTPEEALVADLAAALGETAPTALGQLRRIVQTLGPERVRHVLAQAQAQEAAGGLMLPDGSRRRTPGGVFFRLVRDQSTPAQRRRIWLGSGRLPRRRGPPPARLAHPVAERPEGWARPVSAVGGAGWQRPRSMGASPAPCAP